MNIMADVNGSTEKIAITTEKGDVDKTDVKGEEDNTTNEAVENKNANKPEIEINPEVRAKKIKRQVEYYFGDYNLPTDKFLRNEMKLKDGWISLETLLKFKRLASLTHDPAVVVEALAGSNLVQVSEDKTEVRRNPDKPLPEENEAWRKEVLTRTVYVKGFPNEDFTMDSALDFFDQYGPTDDIVLRFWQDKAAKTWKFKGSVFIKFPTKEAAAAFLALEEVKYGDTPLIRMWQDDYIEKKRKERLDQKMLKRKRPESDEGPLKTEEQKSLPKNATLHMTKCPDTLTREVLKEKVEGMGVVVAFIDFNKGDEEGWIRLHEADTAATVMKECEGGILKLTDGLEVEVKPLEGEEEVRFLQVAKQNISARRAKGGKQLQRGRRGGGRGGGRGGRGGAPWKKRKYEGNSDEPQTKALKVEDCGDDGE